MISRGWRPFLLVLLLAVTGEAQSPDDPSQEEGVGPGPAAGLRIGLDIPDGARATPPDDERALYHDGLTEPRVVRVLAELDSDRLVMLPTGRLAVVARSRAKGTDQPFVAASLEEMTARLRADGLKEHKIERAGYYLFAHDCSEAYYRHTRSILESMLRGVVRQLAEWGLEPRRPETPLVVVIMPSRAAFDAYQDMPAEVAAYYNSITHRVILYEDERLFNSAPEFALKRGSYVVAHEAIHQLLAGTGIQQRLSAWPMWVSEGVPEYFCPLKVNSRLAKVDGDQLPIRTVKWSEAGMVNDLRMHDLLRTPGQGGKVVRTVVGAPGLTAHGYSVAWGLVHYLAEREPEAFAAYLAEVRQKRPLGEPLDRKPRGPDPLFVKHFGDDFGAIERSVREHLGSRKLQKAYRDPYVNQTHYVVSVTFKRGRVFYTQADVLLSPAAARRWRDQRREALDQQNLSGHFVTKECRTAKEAAFHLRRIMN